MSHHGAMDAYSEDLRRKIVQALQQRRMNKSEAAPANVVSLTPLQIICAPAAGITSTYGIYVRYTPHEMGRGL
jgi:hypothetical protein